MGERLYSISDVAEAFELPVSTLRYYDEIGLVTATTRRSRVRPRLGPVRRRRPACQPECATSHYAGPPSPARLPGSDGKKSRYGCAPVVEYQS